MPDPTPTYRTCDEHSSYSGPPGYIARQYWVRMMHKKGHRQGWCAECLHWCWPKEVEGEFSDRS